MSVHRQAWGYQLRDPSCSQSFAPEAFYLAFLNMEPLQQGG